MKYRIGQTLYYIKDYQGCFDIFTNKITNIRKSTIQDKNGIEKYTHIEFENNCDLLELDEVNRQYYTSFKKALGVIKKIYKQYINDINIR